MEGNREKEHLVALKVMRLTKPSLMMTAPVLCGEQDLPQDSLLHTLQHDLAVVHGLENLALGELLTLPQNFGNIFLGETFSSYISVHNDSTQMCRDLLVKADLQTSSQRLTLSGASAQILPQLPPDASVDDVIHHEVKELGTHILVCAVSYTTQSGEKMYFRKFFKFQVLKPLDVKTKFYNAEDQVSDEVYLEAQIQNITPGPIFMERVNLDPSAQYTVAEINSTTPKDRDHSVFGKVPYMCPMDVRQYLYCLSPKPEVAADPRILKGVTNIGKLDIMWKTNMGEKGRLQTSALQRVAPGYGDIRLCIEELCDSVPVEKIFNLKVKVTNCSERNMDLQLILRDTSAVSGLHWCGVSGRHLPSLLPNATTILPLTLLPLHTGLLTISGLQLTDPFLKRTYEHDDLAQVFVYDEAEP